MINWLRKLYFSFFCGCKFGKGVKLSPHINIYRCHFDDYSFCGPFVEVQENAYIGKNTCVQSHAFICAGTKIGNNCFISHGVFTANDKRPKFRNKVWKIQPPIIKDGASIGTGAQLLPGISVGHNAIIGMGSVVTHDVPDDEIWCGNPAKKKGHKKEKIGFNT